MQNPTPGAHYVLLPPPHRSGRTPFRRFREWHARSIPYARYQLETRFWTPAGLRSYLHHDAALRRGMKGRQPTTTALAYDAATVYLVIAAAKANLHHAATLTQCRRLIRNDHDYDAHQGKRIVLVLLCDECPPNVAEFARASRIKIIIGGEAERRAAQESARRGLAERLVDLGITRRPTRRQSHKAPVHVDV